MNPKRVVGITLTVIVLLLLAAGVRLAQNARRLGRRSAACPAGAAGRAGRRARRPWT